MPDSESVAYHREVSLLIDAFDAFPRRVDLAFDSTWKAFEAGLHDLRVAGDNNTTAALAEFARDLGVAEARALADAIDAMPQQAAEFLVARWLDGPLEGNKLARRLANGGASGPGLAELRDRLLGQYDLSEPQDRRNAARLLLLALRGKPVVMSGTHVELAEVERVLVLISGLLYGLRNDRAHGAVPSPFTSSAATLRTFTLPYFAFATTYFLYMTTALSRGHLGTDIASSALAQNLSANLSAARDVLGRHWHV